jgi:hypothetical protein
VRALRRALVLLFPAIALAGGLHEAPVGTRVAETFDLGLHRFYLPPGDWTLIANRSWIGTSGKVLQGPSFGSVYLVEVKGDRLMRAMQAFGVTETRGRRWEPTEDVCKRPKNAAVYRDLSENDLNQFCFEVTELRGYMTRSTGYRQAAQDWLAGQKVTVPRNVLMVRFAYIARGSQAVAYYYFDPAAFGPEPRDAQVQGAAKWAEEHMAEVRAGLGK